MIFLFTNSSTQGNLIAGFLDAEVAPVGYIPLDEVAISSELQGYASGWVQAIETGLAQFFILASDRSTSLVQIESWHSRLDLELQETNGIEYYKNGQRFFLPLTFLSFFQAKYAPFEEPHLFEWYEAQERAYSLQESMTSEINKFLLDGVSFTPVFAALNNLLTNLEANFDTPNEAVEAMSEGLPGLATYLGQSWPPVG